MDAKNYYIECVNQECSWEGEGCHTDTCPDCGSKVDYKDPKGI